MAIPKNGTYPWRLRVGVGTGMRLKLMWVGGAIALLALVIGYRDILFGVTYRYRLTLEVTTPEGLRSGTTVVEVKTWQAPAFPSPEAGGIRTKYRGEAVAVDLPGRQTLFVLLNGASTLASRNFLQISRGSKRSALDWERDVKSTERAVDIPIVPLTPQELQGKFTTSTGEREPLFVRFRDPKNPASLERVDPANLSASFGDGFSIRRMIVQITDDPITSHMTERLPWLKTGRPGPLSGEGGRTFPLGLMDVVDTGSFTTEIRR